MSYPSGICGDLSPEEVQNLLTDTYFKEEKEKDSRIKLEIYKAFNDKRDVLLKQYMNDVETHVHFLYKIFDLKPEKEFSRIHNFYEVLAGVEHRLHFLLLRFRKHIKVLNLNVVHAYHKKFIAECAFLENYLSHKDFNKPDINIRDIIFYDFKMIGGYVVKIKSEFLQGKGIDIVHVNNDGILAPRFGEDFVGLLNQLPEQDYLNTDYVEPVGVKREE